jgi:hypothetical protein
VSVTVSLYIDHDRRTVQMPDTLLIALVKITPDDPIRFPDRPLELDLSISLV